MTLIGSKFPQLSALALKGYGSRFEINVRIIMFLKKESKDTQHTRLHTNIHTNTKHCHYNVKVYNNHGGGYKDNYSTYTSLKELLRIH